MIAQRAIAAMALSATLMALPAPVLARQATADAAFHDRVIELYDFDPAKLSKEQILAKSVLLDAFWKTVSEAPASALPALRAELAASHTPFFYYDASKLLLSLSSSAEDRGLALQSMARADLRGLQIEDYVRTVQKLAVAGADTTTAALHILAYPDVRAYFPQHALTLRQDYSLIYMLFPRSEADFVPALIKRLHVESDPVAQKSLLLALWCAATPASLAAIDAFAADPASPEAVRAKAAALYSNKKTLPISFSFSSIESLRAKRREVMSRPPSDEALMTFERLTLQIQAKL